jgi:ABC-type Fe3+-hydroxamate transport system, periplasmic component
MKSNKIIAIMAIVIILATGIVGIYVLNKSDDTDANTITDMRGRKVALPETIDSIICFSSCSLELVSYFDAVEKVSFIDTNEYRMTPTDRTYYYTMKEKFQNLERIDPGNSEIVSGTGADLIIASTIEVQTLNDRQNEYGIPIFAINADLEFGPEFDRQLRLLGKLFGEEDRAEEIVSGIARFISDIVDNVPESYDIRGYACGMNFQNATVNAFLRASGDYLPFEYSKITNIFESNSSGSPPKQPLPVGVEVVLDRSPDYIFIDGVNLSVSKEYLKDRLAIFTEKTNAVPDNVYKVMIYKSWGTNWENQLINAYFIADIIHGDVLDWNFEEKADEILRLFYRDAAVSYSDLASVQTGGGCGKISF